MIILDTCILRGCGFDDSPIELLRAIRGSKVQSIGIPWVVLEELAAQKAVKYTEQHEAATAALKSLAGTTPWKLSHSLEDADPERVRQYWRERYRQIADEIPTSEQALRTAAFREANGLAPAKVVVRGKEKIKTSYRDVAIWMSAVEYAREHPDEPIYFVSSNTNDFGDGTSYRESMVQDIAEFGDRFVHLTSIEEVVERFTEPAQISEEQVREILSSETCATLLGEEAAKIMRTPNGDDPFEMTGLMLLGHKGGSVLSAGWRMPPTAQLNDVQDIQAHKIGDQVWCTATARWQLAGIGEVTSPGMSEYDVMACSWQTRVLFASHEEPGLTVIKPMPPRALTPEEAQPFAEIAESNGKVGQAVLALMLAFFLSKAEDPRPPRGWLRA
ncbi:PIN domain-containing protein [Streptomyces sp. NPDC020096]